MSWSARVQLDKPITRDALAALLERMPHSLRLIGIVAEQAWGWPMAVDVSWDRKVRECETIYLRGGGAGAMRVTQFVHSLAALLRGAGFTAGFESNDIEIPPESLAGGRIRAGVGASARAAAGGLMARLTCPVCSSAYKEAPLPPEQKMRDTGAAYARPLAEQHRNAIAILSSLIAQAAARREETRKFWPECRDGEVSVDPDALQFVLNFITGKRIMFRQG